MAIMGQPGGPQTAESSGEAQDAAAERADAVESNPQQHGTPAEDRSGQAPRRLRSADQSGPVKLAVVVQRYGQAINGGAELHARYIAEHLARHAQVEVLTTCASDYVTWRNELPDGVDRVNGVAVRRFPVKHERDPLVFGKRSEHVFNERHSLDDELDWLDAEGPTSTALVDYIGKHASDFDFLIFFSYRVLPLVPRRPRRGFARGARCRRPSAIRRSGSRSSSPFSGACAR